MFLWEARLCRSEEGRFPRVKLTELKKKLSPTTYHLGDLVDPCLKSLIVLHLEGNKLAGHSLIGAGKRYETPGPVTENSLLLPGRGTTRAPAFVLASHTDSCTRHIVLYRRILKCRAPKATSIRGKKSSLLHWIANNSASSSEGDSVSPFEGHSLQKHPWQSSAFVKCADERGGGERHEELSPNNLL